MENGITSPAYCLQFCACAYPQRDARAHLTTSRHDARWCTNRPRACKSKFPQLLLPRNCIWKAMEWTIPLTLLTFVQALVSRAATSAKIECLQHNNPNAPCIRLDVSLNPLCSQVSQFCCHKIISDCGVATENYKRNILKIDWAECMY